MTVSSVSSKPCTGCHNSPRHRQHTKCLSCLRLARRRWAMTATAKRRSRTPIRVPNAQRHCQVCHKLGVHAKDLCRSHYKTHAERRPCSIPSCTRGMHAQDLCYIHYDVARRSGLRLVQSQGVLSPEERFARYVMVTSSCHLWTGKLINGRGAFTVKDGISSPAHRVAYVFDRGEIPTDDEGSSLEIDHGCRVGSCVRSEHLEAVTHQENMRRHTVAMGYADITQADGWLFGLAIPAWQRGHDNFPSTVVTQECAA